MDKEFTSQNVELVAQAFSETLNRDLGVKNKTAHPRVVIGFDNRKDSDRFARSAAEVLAGNGIQVLLSREACPTQAVSFMIVHEHFDAGLVVTASHNPSGYNGLKLKSRFGSSADKTTTDAVESAIGKNPVLKKQVSPNIRINSFNQKYLDFLQQYLRLDLIRRAPYKILVDSMHGTGARHIETLLSGGEIRVTTIRAQRDIHFGGVSPEPIPQNLGPSIERMKKGEFDLALATDGDADRVGALRPGGEFISPGILLALILLHFVEDLKKSGSVVTTISNTALIFKVARRLGLQVHETPVGFKYICEVMRRERVLIGGEESGGIGFQDYLYERDGLLSGLLVIQMMAMRKKSFDQLLRELEEEFTKLYYVRRDLEYPNELKPKLFKFLSQSPPKKLIDQPVKEIKSQDGMKFILPDDSWLLFRLSGTEPILRIYAEAPSLETAEALVDQGKELAFHL